MSQLCGAYAKKKNAKFSRRKHVAIAWVVHETSSLGLTMGWRAFEIKEGERFCGKSII